MSRRGTVPAAPCRLPCETPCVPHRPALRKGRRVHLPVPAAARPPNLAQLDRSRPRETMVSVATALLYSQQKQHICHLPLFFGALSATCAWRRCYICCAAPDSKALLVSSLPGVVTLTRAFPRSRLHEGMDKGECESAAERIAQLPSPKKELARPPETYQRQVVTPACPYWVLDACHWSRRWRRRLRRSCRVSCAIPE